MTTCGDADLSIKMTMPLIVHMLSINTIVMNDLMILLDTVMKIAFEACLTWPFGEVQFLVPSVLGSFSLAQSSELTSHV